MSGRPPAPWMAVAVAAAAVIAAAPGIGNGFVYDDAPIIVDNPLIHPLSNAPALWTSGYWPAGLLYRPVATQLFALEWAAGGGRPLAFHIVSIGLALTAALLFWRLSYRLLPSLAAWLVALLFAVHPVHVEVVANAVGQAELLATIFALIVVERYLAWRREGPLSVSRRALLAILTLLSILSKETGYVIPVLCAAAELLVVRPARGASWQAREAGSVLGLQMAAVLAAILLRVAVLGPTPAAGPAVALRDLPAVERIVGMLAVVPHWVRLLFWPAHLQAEYGPPALAVTGAVGGKHLLGLGIVVASFAVGVICLRRAPVLALGLAWSAAALLPVSNLLTATGVILAERTLFLPSAGAMLAAGTGLASLLAWLKARRSSMRRVVLAGVGVLAMAALVRTMERQRVWRSQEAFFDRLLADAPTSYRAHLVASVYYARSGRAADAEGAARRGLELFRGDPHLYEHLGQLLRRDGRCLEALPVLTEAVWRFPDQTIARSRLIECTLVVGDSAGALRLAEQAVSTGHLEFEQTIRRLSPPR